MTVGCLMLDTRVLNIPGAIMLYHPILPEQDWMDRFPKAQLSHLSTNTSDHLPILLCLGSPTEGVIGLVEVETRDSWESAQFDSRETGAAGCFATRSCKDPLSGTKAPEPDGMSALFFQHYWGIVEDDVCKLCFKLLISVCNEIDSILSNFWWSTLCQSKENGGLGFGDTRSFNQAMLCKQACKLLTEPQSYLSRIFKARYFPQGDFWSTSLGAKPSYTWGSILSVRDLIRQGTKWQLWQLGNGQNKCVGTSMGHTYF
ncbi:hypothetical protein LIER_35518 [Lithospermum erythrorhizon]|uniref:Uncharacterized protein n=1 Tax=Lithospermum erythrorhizon TaxID=34254 RepID=A0AAV3NRV9_LITER